MCHVLVFFSPLPTRVPLKQQPDTNCDVYRRAVDPRGPAVGTKLGGGRFGLGGQDGHDRLESYVLQHFCVRIMYGYEMYYIQCSFCS